MRRGRIHGVDVTPTSPARVVIVSRRPLLRGLLAGWLRGLPQADTILEFSTIDEANSVKCAGAELLLLDAPDCLVFGTVATVRAVAPSIKVLIISAGQGDYVLHRASAAGATGVVHEGDSLETFAAALAAVSGGGVYHSPGVMQRCAAIPVMKSLTRRELLVLELACAGTSDEESAKALGCAAATVETHRRHLMAKIGAADWGELMILGVRLGVVSIDRIAVGSRRRRTSPRRRRP